MVSQLAFVLFGVMVGTVISLDNIAAITVLASKHGTNIKLIVSEIWAHIVLVVVGWYIGYLLMPYRNTFSYIAAFVLFLLGGVNLYENLRRKEKRTVQKHRIWNNKKSEVKFFLLFFPTVIALMLSLVYILSLTMDFSKPLTGLVFAVGAGVISFLSLLFSIKVSM
ncbi:MAG: hypothetical protein J7L41_01295 [Synergistetes bacterium]|nr:hypothetical protein [Synergistota bacterium]